MMATYEANADLINIGAYKAGTNLKIDRAVGLVEPLNAFLKQDIAEGSGFESTVSQLKNLAGNQE
jgi:flagellum-specific ATP synthase